MAVAAFMVHHRNIPYTILGIAVLLLLNNLLPNQVLVDAFPGAAGHCSTGDLNGKGSGHGEDGGGALSNGQLRVKFNSSSLLTYTTANLNANQQYTVTLDFSTTNSNFFFRGLLFRLSGKNDEDVSGTFSVSDSSDADDPNVQLKSGCDAGISAVTHTNRLDKTSVSFYFEYTESTDADLLLEVTVVRERAADNWFYSSYNIQIGDGGSVSTSAPTLSPTTSPTASPIISPTTSPVSSETNTSSPSSSSTTSSSCVDSRLRFRTRKPTDGSYIWRDCNWVEKKSTNLRCTWDDVSSICPKICNACSGSDTCADATGRFRVNYNGKNIARNCIWVGNKSTRLRCAGDGVADTCPLTCDNC